MSDTRDLMANLTRSRLLFLREVTTLEIIRAQYQERGMVDEALKMERLLDSMRESALILADLATGEVES